FCFHYHVRCNCKLLVSTMSVKLCVLFLITTTVAQTQGFVNGANDEISVKIKSAETPQIYVRDISETDFKVEWYSANFGNGKAHNYTILNTIEGCNANEIDIQCKIDICKHYISEYCNGISPCTDVTLSVRDNDDGITSEQLKFNTAPHVEELENMTIEVNGIVATVTWNSESDTNQDSRCATKAKIEISVDGTTIEEHLYNTVIGQPNTVQVDLDPCEGGPVDAYIKYVTISGEFDTESAVHKRADGEFPGIGIEEPPLWEPGDVSCSIKVSWQSNCTKVDYYILTLDYDEPLSLNETSHTIPDMEPGNHIVCVSAYYENDLIGEELCRITNVQPVLPGATKIDKLGLEDDSNNELTVLWTGPNTQGCPLMDGFHITWRKAEQASIIGHKDTLREDTKYTITGLNSSTMYEVKVQAYSDIGIGPAGYMNATTSKDDGDKEGNNNLITIYIMGGIGGLIILALGVTSIYICAVKCKKDHKDGVDGPAAHMHMKELDGSQNQESRIAPEREFNQDHEYGVDDRAAHLHMNDIDYPQDQEFRYAPETNINQVYLPRIPTKFQRSVNRDLKLLTVYDEPLAPHESNINGPGTHRSRKSIGARTPMESKGDGSYRYPHSKQQQDPMSYYESHESTTNGPGTHRSHRSQKSINARIPMGSKGVGLYRDPHSRQQQDPRSYHESHESTTNGHGTHRSRISIDARLQRTSMRLKGAGSYIDPYS
ncbi:unnamed protein product, partial [Meganyctiphanes norvegica]